MNDPGLDEPISDSFNVVTRNLREELRERESQNPKSRTQESGSHDDVQSNDRDEDDDNKTSEHITSIRNELQMDEQEEEVGFFQPTLWWFTSTAFPLVAGTFGPIANLFSVCALAQTWLVDAKDGSRIKDPSWLISLNAVSLLFALGANLLLLFNFAHRVRYAIAQPLTITLWYLAFLLLVPPLSLTHTHLLLLSGPSRTLSQAFYYALIAAIIYFIISTLLLLHLLGARLFHAYPASFSALTIPQRTLMLQTVIFSLYLALGAGIFARLEGWSFADGVYWADYTLLTIGLGSDLPLLTTASRMLVIPYAGMGLVVVGMLVGSVRGLVLERGKIKVVRRRLGKERQQWLDRIKGQEQNRLLRRKKKIPDGLEEDNGKWEKAEFELMRRIQESAEETQRYMGLAVSLFAYIIVWIGGSLVFWATERKSDGWTYPEALYFSYTSITTIGYGDFFPTSAAGRPFFVIWSLLAVPVVTILISHMGNTIVRSVGKATEWLGRMTILPERSDTAAGRVKQGEKKNGPGQRRRSNDAVGRKVNDTLGKGGSTSKLKQGSEEGDTPEYSSDRSRGLGKDVEHLGSAVEHAEATQGRPESLSARLAKEISQVARDVGRKPPKSYSWEEWTRWLDMLGEGSEEGDGKGADGSDSDSEETRVDKTASDQDGGDIKVGRVSESPRISVDGKMVDTYDADQQAEHRQQNRKAAQKEKPKVQWSWLSDDGPLFSHGTETEWVLAKLCKRLEEVLKSELQGVRNSKASD